MKFFGVLVFGLCASVAVADDDFHNEIEELFHRDSPILKDSSEFHIYDLKSNLHSNNIVPFETFGKEIKEKGFFKFTDDAFTSHTHAYINESTPAMIVYQPFGTVTLLEGHYLPEGLASFFLDQQDEDFENEHLRKFIFSGLTEGVSPAAAKLAYPFFYEYPLAAVGDDKFANIDTDFLVLFVAPIHLRENVLDQLEPVAKVEYESPIFIVDAKDF